MNLELDKKVLRPYFFFLSIAFQSTRNLSLWRLFITIIQAINPLLILYTFKLIVDLVIDRQEANNWHFDLIVILGSWGVLTLLQLVLNHIQAYISEVQYQINVDEINQKIHSKAQGLSLLDFENPSLQDTLHFVGARVKKVVREFPVDLEKVLQNGFTLVGVFWIIGGIHWAVIPLFILTILPGSYIRFKSAQKIQKLEWQTVKSERKAQYFHDLLIGKKPQKEVKIDSLFERVSEAFKRERKVIFDGKLEIHRALLRKGFFSNISEVVFILLALVYLTFQSRSDNISVGDLVLYITTLQKGQSVANAALRNAINLYKHLLPLKHFHKYLHLPEKLNPVSEASQISGINSITVSEVSFEYPGNNSTILKGVNLQFHKGEIHAIVGKNGSGKSTLIKLLSGLFTPNSGHIQLNGQALLTLENAAFWSRLGVVFQDFNCYQLPVYQNMTSLEREDQINHKRLNDIVGKLGLGPMIESLPNQNKTWLGNALEKGQDLSGGQWQSLALFRALYKNPEVLIMDEPTSFMDGDREQKFLQFLLREKESKKRIIIIVSHRLSNIKIADHIHVLVDGEVRSSGDHITLIENSVEYRALFKLQENN